MGRPGSTFTLAIVTISFLLGFVSSASGETYYRWIDDRGNPVHSDRPPPKGTDYEVVSTQSSLLRPVMAEEGAVPPETQPKVGNEFQPVDTKQVQVEKKNPEYCQRARDNLLTLEESVRIRIRNDQGEYRYLNEEEKAAQREQAQKMIDLHCE